MKSNNFIRSAASVIFSNFFILLSGILVGFVLPKIMGVEQYGYYKLFILYTTYIVLLYFGFADGMLVKYGGQTEEEINHHEIEYITRFFIKMETIVSIVMLILSLCCLHDEYRIIFSLLSIFTFLSNLVTYYRYLAQAMMNFDIISRTNILQSIMTSSIVIICYLLVSLKVIRTLSASLYLIMFLCVFFILLLILAYNIRPSIWNNKQKKKLPENSWQLLRGIFKIGIPVAVSSQIGTLILNLDNQLISMFFSNRVFGIYSFAYSLISIISTIIVPISSVIFPFLNRQDNKSIIKQYDFNTSILFIFVYASLIIYYPARLFIEWYLPNYTQSLIYFRLLLPGVGITSCISILVFNYYKVLNKSNIYLAQGLLILIFSLALNLLAYYITKSAIAIAIVSLIVLVGWYIYTNFFFVKNYHIKWKRNTCFLLLMIFAFEFSTGVHNLWLSFICYLFLYLLFIFIFFRKRIYYIMMRFSKHV